MGTATGKQQWHASYWSEQKHGSAWERVKEAMRRDWAQTKNDFKSSSGRDLNQDIDDTVKQAVGKEPIPAPNQPNPEFDRVEPALSYGYGAREEYGQKYPQWDEKLESQLSHEWDANQTGMRFDEAKPHIRRGYEYRKP
ncbi:MAG: hypothetical protein IPJ65_36120 [Archangiaceae bacterium]|nr:hypothetical protein [Archangiaceae bacterium]